MHGSMPALELDARVRVLTALQTNEGMAAVDARAIDSACAQYAQGDLDEYTVHVEECVGVWRANRALRPFEVVVRAVQPPAASVSSAGAGPVHVDAETADREARRKALRSKMSICPKCKSTDFTTLEFEKQQRAADEGADPWRRCQNPKCRHEWPVRGVEVNEKPKVVRKRKTAATQE